MKRSVRLVSLGAAAALLAVVLPACRRDAHTDAQETSPPPVAPIAPQTSAWSHEEIFRRAFWRQPAAADRIVHAEREEWTTSDGTPVQRWRWFLELHPGPELLAALRDPETFGMLRLPPGAAPRPWSDPSKAPAWFPAPATLAPADFEILQAPAAGLTILYRASDDTLFATDTGSGFAPPAR